MEEKGPVPAVRDRPSRQYHNPDHGPAGAAHWLAAAGRAHCFVKCGSVGSYAGWAKDLAKDETVNITLSALGNYTKKYIFHCHDTYLR